MTVTYLLKVFKFCFSFLTSKLSVAHRQYPLQAMGTCHAQAAEMLGPSVSIPAYRATSSPLVLPRGAVQCQGALRPGMEPHLPVTVRTHCTFTRLCFIRSFDNSLWLVLVSSIFSRYRLFTATKVSKK